VATNWTPGWELTVRLTRAGTVDEGRWTELAAEV
jgi:hypothetical protein